MTLYDVCRGQQVCFWLVAESTRVVTLIFVVRRSVMFKKLVCLVIVMALASAAQALEFSDDFDHVMTDDWSRINYQGWYEQNVLQPVGYPATYPGGPWVIGSWDGYQSLPGNEMISPTVTAHNFVNTFNYGMGEANAPQAWTPGTEGEVLNGVLRVVSTNGGWSDTWNTGPFLYKHVTAESFVAEVEVVASDYWWHHMGGLMVRAPNEEFAVGDKFSAVSGAGANENWVYLSYFPVWGIGNHMRNTVGGVSEQSGGLGYPGDPYMRITGIYGNSWTFFFETSPDGTNWTAMPAAAGIPGYDPVNGLVRDDLPDTLQVGIFQANFTGDWLTNMDFDNFSITVPEPATIALLGLGGLVLLRRRK
jgi:hypothetical protein